MAVWIGLYLVLVWLVPRLRGRGMEHVLGLVWYCYGPVMVLFGLYLVLIGLYWICIWLYLVLLWLVSGPN